MSLEAHVATAAGEVVLRLIGELDIETRAVVVSRVGEALEDGHSQRAVVIDLSQVTFVDSSGLSALVAVHRQASAAGTTLRLRAPSAAVSQLLRLTALDTVLQIEP